MKIKSVVFAALVLTQLFGCAGLAEMKKSSFSRAVEKNEALINFVRPRVFLGDGAKVEVWDGSKFVGTLAAGTMIQYKATPGPHVLMVYTQGSWGIAKGELIAGKTYYLKYNVGMGFITLGSAEANDPRIQTWNTELTPMMVDQAKSKPVPQSEIDAAQQMLNKVEKGTAKFETIAEVNAI